jgi:CheY-like chemotaxis protein/two-component sensor histidine kinase
MNAIIGFADFLSRPGVTEPKKSHFTSLIQQRSYDLLRIIEDILDISRLEVGQMSIIESEFILSDLMKELLEYYKLKKTKTEANSSISLQLSLDESLKGISISADQFRLKQILNNLLDNAFKFTQHGLIEFGCKLMVNANDASLQFFVKDTGIGIPANKFDLIFDRFCQADDSLIARKYGGTGLGLSIVKGMVKLMNGKIWLESRENSGTTFYFTLPLIQTTSKEEPNTEVKNSQNIWWENKTVLLVEDDESNTIYLTEVLAQKGLTLLNAYTGKDALQIFKNNPNIDLILMDIRLPDINGLIVTRKIKKKNPDVVIIAQTAYATPKDIKDCLKAGCNDYLSKPIMYEKMILLLDQYLRKK